MEQLAFWFWLGFLNEGQIWKQLSRLVPKVWSPASLFTVLDRQSTKQAVLKVWIPELSDPVVICERHILQTEVHLFGREHDFLFPLEFKWNRYWDICLLYETRPFFTSLPLQGGTDHHLEQAILMTSLPLSPTSCQWWAVAAALLVCD